MRVLYLHAETELGGAGVSLLGLIQHLPGDRVQPVVAIPGTGGVQSRLSGLSIPFEVAYLHRFSYHEERYAAQGGLFRVKLYWHLLEIKALLALLLSLPAQYVSLKRLIEKTKPDLIHINSITLLAAGLLARRWDVPVVWHVRDILAKNWLGRWAGVLIPKSADRVVAISRAVAGRLDNRQGNIVVVYNGIDLYRFRTERSGAEARQDFDIPSDAPCIGFVGRLTQQKGFVDLLETAPAILKAMPAVHFLLVGSFVHAQGKGKLRQFMDAILLYRSANDESAIRKRIDELGLASRFHLTGPRSDVPSLLAAMDVVALPSYSEGFGLTVVEAMAMGKAVVSTCVTAIPELLKHGRHGLLVEPGNRDQLADACIRLLQDTPLAYNYGKNARRRASVFTLDREARCIQVVYEKLLHKEQN